ncbi:hypothetical protein O185_17160 [Photorhabdus temperata J3]|uniref:Uncharacterized protein n=1 Tax=Photorhabdus temperata J3 TaxID=1389415 RepID=U7QXW9_PHOTE|nr:hypothetical protein O185_17160 [Photorhabdus temperata J3]
MPYTTGLSDFLLNWKVPLNSAAIKPERHCPTEQERNQQYIEKQNQIDNLIPISVNYDANKNSAKNFISNNSKLISFT